MEQATVEQQQAVLRSKLQCSVCWRAWGVGCGVWGAGFGSVGLGGNRRGLGTETPGRKRLARQRPQNRGFQEVPPFELAPTRPIMGLACHRTPLCAPTPRHHGPCVDAPAPPFPPFEIAPTRPIMGLACHRTPPSPRLPNGLGRMMLGGRLCGVQGSGLRIEGLGFRTRACGFRRSQFWARARALRAAGVRALELSGCVGQVRTWRTSAALLLVTLPCAPPEGVWELGISPSAPPLASSACSSQPESSACLGRVWGLGFQGLGCRVEGFRA